MAEESIEEKEAIRDTYIRRYKVPRDLEENKRKLFAMIYDKDVTKLSKNAMMYFVGKERIVKFVRRKIKAPVPEKLAIALEEQRMKSKYRFRMEEPIAPDEPIKSRSFVVTQYTSRGQHIVQVAKVARGIAERLGLSKDKIELATIAGAAHDYGHSLFAHTGENALTRYLNAHKENGKEIVFSHVLHSKFALLQDAKKNGIEVPIELQNAIGAHSSSYFADPPMSLIAEIILTADKVASAVSDTRDMIKSGAINFEEDFHAPKVEEKVRRVLEKIRGEKFKVLSKGEQERIVFDSIEAIKSNFTLRPEVQRVILVNDVVKETRTKEKEALREERHRPIGIDPNYKRVLRRGEKTEVILAVARGVLEHKEEVKNLGKKGEEAEELIYQVAEYICANRETYENTKPFLDWKTDITVDDEPRELRWEDRVAYGLADFTDQEFVKFAKELLIANPEKFTWLEKQGIKGESNKKEKEKAVDSIMKVEPPQKSAPKPKVYLEMER